jgi:hypothetical protein
MRVLLLFFLYAIGSLHAWPVWHERDEPAYTLYITSGDATTRDYYRNVSSNRAGVDLRVSQPIGYNWALLPLCYAPFKDASLAMAESCSLSESDLVWAEHNIEAAMFRFDGVESGYWIVPRSTTFFKGYRMATSPTMIDAGSRINLRIPLVAIPNFGRSRVEVGDRLVQIVAPDLTRPRVVVVYALPLP